MNPTNRQLAPDADNPVGLIGGDAPINMPAKKYRPTQPVVLAMLLIVTVGSIAAMRAFAGKAIIESGTATQVDYTHTIDPARTAEYDRIMNDLARLERPMQLDVDLAAAAAFGEAKRSQVVATASGESNGDRQSRESARTKSELTSKASALVVQSVMGGRRPVARISGETYGVGDKVNDTFTVKAIDGRSVTLEAKGYLFTLSMEVVQQKRVPGSNSQLSPSKSSSSKPGVSKPSK
jgi:hypothetical protein